MNNAFLIWCSRWMGMPIWYAGRRNDSIKVTCTRSVAFFLSHCDKALSLPVEKEEESHTFWHWCLKSVVKKDNMMGLVNVQFLYFILPFYHFTLFWQGHLCAFKEKCQQRADDMLHGYWTVFHTFSYHSWLLRGECWTMQIISCEHLWIFYKL